LPFIKCKSLRKEEILSEAEVEEMIEKAEICFPEKASMIKCLIALLWLFGKRISEVLRLKRKDVWFDEHFLYVRFTVLKKKGEYKAVKKITLKNPFVKHVIQYIQLIEEPEAWLFPGRSRPKVVKVKAKLRNGTVKTYEYERVESGNMSRQEAWRLLKKLNPTVWFHLFRDTVATKFAYEGATPYELQSWFDWEKLETANKYIKRGSAFIERLAQRVW